MKKIWFIIAVIVVAAVVFTVSMMLRPQSTTPDDAITSPDNGGEESDESAAMQDEPAEIDDLIRVSEPQADEESASPQPSQQDVIYDGEGITVGDDCVITGCSSQVCAAEEQTTTCEYRPEYACYTSATCERQTNGECGWTPSVELLECLNNTAGQ